MTTKPDIISSKGSHKNSIQGIQLLAEELYQQCLENHKIVATAESCTGGLLSAFITEVAGSSAMFDRAFITYSNAAKKDMLDVSDKSLMSYGAVSETVATEMLGGALRNSKANIGISITGIAGPSGGNDEKPVGTVCFAWGSEAKQFQSTEHFQGNRQEVRLLAVKFSFEQLLLFISKQSN